MIVSDIASSGGFDIGECLSSCGSPTVTDTLSIRREIVRMQIRYNAMRSIACICVCRDVVDIVCDVGLPDLIKKKVDCISF